MPPALPLLLPPVPASCPFTLHLHLAPCPLLLPLPPAPAPAPWSLPPVPVSAYFGTLSSLILSSSSFLLLSSVSSHLCVCYIMADYLKPILTTETGER